MESTLIEQPIIHNQLIAGVWREAYSGSVMSVTNPATDQTVGVVPDSARIDAQDAVDAAHDAFCTWRATSAKYRAGLLKAWNAAIMANREELADIISLEQGKPKSESLSEINYAASYVEWYAEEATRINGEIIPPAFTNKKMFITREPVGVVAAITPWNFPAAMITRKIAPALAAGCTVVCKPAEDTPLTALALVRLAQEAGIPDGVLNIVTASRKNTPQVVDVWLQDSRVRKISFTGSTLVGKELARYSASTLKRVSLELGGIAPFIIFEDADIEDAIEGLMASKFRNSGQTCVCPNRVLVHRSIHDSFVNRLGNRVRQLKVGPATDPDSEIGPMINSRAISKIDRHIQEAVNSGAQIIVGGTVLDLGNGFSENFFSPTILTNVKSEMECCNEETFGPLIPITAFETEEEAVSIANDTPYGLAAYFYSSNATRLWRVAEALQFGMVGINEGNIASEAAPFGGIKDSGYGREGSIHGINDYLQIKYLCQGL